jgi:hypothetical protein
MKKALPFILLGILVLFVVLIQVYAPKTISWVQTFEKKDKNPYGDFILYDFLQNLFPDKKIEVKNRTIYEVLDYYDYAAQDEYSYDSSVTVDTVVAENYDAEKLKMDSTVNLLDSAIQDNTPNNENSNVEDEELKNLTIIPDLRSQYDSSLSDLKNYVIINTSFSPGKTDAKALFDFVQKGNCVFISAQEMTGTLVDSLNIELKIDYFEQELSKKDLAAGSKKDSIYLTLLNEKLKTHGKKYWYRDGTVTGYFSSFDTSSTIVLGKNSNGQANFIRVQFGAGVFLISTTPLAFTNYNMLLEDNAEFISASLSYLPVRDTYWDEYYKNYRETDNDNLRFIKSQPPLFWAYYVALFSAIAYIVFETKRRQRIIPVVEPPRNTTVEFVSTIGRLYFQNRNHKDIASKKIYYFLEYIRAKFYVTTTVFDKEFIDKLSERSGIDKAKVSQLFALIQNLQQTSSVNQKDLMELNKRIEEFRVNA